MIELFLSTDGKHTVHISADTPEQMKELVLKAKALYQEVLAEFGAKGQMRDAGTNSKNTGYANGQAASTGQAQGSRRMKSVQTEAIPHCPMHKRSMAFRQGRLGPFWSCPTRRPDGRWCQVTKEVISAGSR